MQTDAFIFLKIYLYVCLPACMYVNHEYAGAHGAQKRTLNSLKLELHILMSC